MLTIKKVQKRCKETGQKIFYYPTNNNQGFIPCCWIDHKANPDEFFFNGEVFTINEFEKHIGHENVSLFVLEKPKKKREFLFF